MDTERSVVSCLLALMLLSAIALGATRESSKDDKNNHDPGDMTEGQTNSPAPDDKNPLEPEE